jgi:transposase
MSTTSKSPKKVVRTALRVAARVLSEYSHHMSPKKFTQPQLFACLVLKLFFKRDYRGIVILLADMPELRRAIGLKAVPHYTTLQKAAQRILTSKQLNGLLAATLHTLRKRIELAAIDATGLESGHISPYFIKRRSESTKTRQNSQMTRWPKMAVIAETAQHYILAVHTTYGPQSDSGHFKQTLALLPEDLNVQKLLADAGYDSEANHQWANEICGIKTVIPPKIGNPTNALPTKPYRRSMATNFDSDAYRQRWQVETVFSMIKRNLGYAIRSKREQNRNAEMCLMAITHNLMILYLLMSFSTEQRLFIVD